MFFANANVRVTIGSHTRVRAAAASPAAWIHRILEKEKNYIDLWKLHLLNLSVSS